MNFNKILRLASLPKLYSKKCNGFVSRNLPPLCCSRMSTVSISQSKERDSFQDTLPCIINSLVADPKFADVPEIGKWLKKMLEYNLSGGKKTRGLATVVAYEILEKTDNITEESLKLARIMGWCVEMLQAYFLVCDDMMDGSTTRRGAPCWYRIPEVGLGAINDSILIYSSLFHTLNTYFSTTQHYTEILFLFSDTVMLTSAGQHLDFTMAQRKHDDYSRFTIQNYSNIIKHKTSYYTFKLPVFLGMFLSNIVDKETHRRAEEICLDIGNLFQMQDDFIDCFGDESVTGKAGTDIQEGKCTWLAVTALQRCDPTQRRLFEQYYGSKDPSNVQRIKQLYHELDLPRVYKDVEREQYDKIVNKAHALSKDTELSPKLFLKLLDMIYKRNQ